MLSDSDVIEILREQYSDARGWVVIPQAPDAARRKKVGGGDALLMQLWGSCGPRLYGVAYTPRRSDFDRVVNHSDMDEGLAAYCHYWYVLAPEGVVSRDQLPPRWGLWEIDAQHQLRRRKKAGLRKPKQCVAWDFLASVLQGVVRTGLTEDERVRANQAGFADGQAAMKAACDHEMERLRALARQVSQFEAASGIAITHGWNQGCIGAALRRFMDPTAGAFGLQQRLEQIVQVTEGLARDARQRLETLPAEDPGGAAHQTKKGPVDKEHARRRVLPG